MKKILDAILQIWANLKKIVVKVISFVRHIANWVKQTYRKAIMKHPNAIPIAIEIGEKLENGNYNTVDLNLTNEAVAKTFYDEQTGEILAEFTEIVMADDLDEQTRTQLGDEGMIVFK